MSNSTKKTSSRSKPRPEILANLKKEKLVLDWRKRQQARAEVRVTIEKVLDAGLPRVYTPELFNQKSSAVYQHVYDA
ncbi:type I restriction enzyme endonuclease domain-containing protein [Desulfonatronum thioautotrophicum]|uniref:type I restriction enzyme endonuclease domain-containing protein n=1 Tax=Desulfonatronum thioautotrophicum TaxID=617001 RepID=UPI001ABF3411